MPMLSWYGAGGGNGWLKEQKPPQHKEQVQLSIENFKAMLGSVGGGASKNNIKRESYTHC